MASTEPARASDPLAVLEAAIGHRFANRALLSEALTHSSALDGAPGLTSNERLEFFGDRVLGLIVAARLLKAFPAEGEAGLAPRFNALVNRGACAAAARRLGLGAALRLSKAEAQAGGHDKDTILADACEALIAAAFLDGGLSAAEALFEAGWTGQIETLAIRPREPKAALQEWAAAHKRPPPTYQPIAQSGPAHAPQFVIAVAVAGAGAAEGRGSSKREAEQAAAARLLAELSGE